MGRLEELENDVQNLGRLVRGLQGRNKELYAILSDVQEFKDSVEARLQELEDEKSVRVEGNQYHATRLRTIEQTLRIMEDRMLELEQKEETNDDFRFRFPTEEDIKEKLDNACTGIGDNNNAKFVDCGRALELVNKIEQQLPREVFAWKYLHLDFKELRQILGGSDD